jgi:hypothetical protein
MAFLDPSAANAAIRLRPLAANESVEAFDHGLIVASAIAGSFRAPIE